MQGPSSSPYPKSRRLTQSWPRLPCAAHSSLPFLLPNRCAARPSPTPLRLVSLSSSLRPQIDAAALRFNLRGFKSSHRLLVYSPAAPDGRGSLPVAGLRTCKHAWWWSTKPWSSTRWPRGRWVQPERRDRDTCRRPPAGLATEKMHEGRPGDGLPEVLPPATTSPTCSPRRSRSGPATPSTTSSRCCLHNVRLSEAYEYIIGGEFLLS